MEQLRLKHQICTMLKRFVWSNQGLDNRVHVIFNTAYAFGQPLNISRVPAMVQNSTPRKSFHTTRPVLFSHLSFSSSLLGTYTNFMKPQFKEKNCTSIIRNQLAIYNFGFCKYFSICNKRINI